MTEPNYWGGNPEKVGLGVVTEPRPAKIPEKLEGQERDETLGLTRAKEAVLNGESTLYLVAAPPVDFSMMNIGLAGEIYEISYDNKIYGYSANAKIFRARS